MLTPSNTQDKYAFFDVDGTLISVKSMFSFRDYCRGKLSQYSGIKGAIKYFIAETEHKFLSMIGVRRELLNELYYRNFQGVREYEIDQLVNCWYASLSRSEDFYIEETVSRLRKHKDQGHKIVLVSGSFCQLLEPIALELGADYCLATNLETVNGIFTGKIIPPQTIGDGKKKAISEFAKSYSVNLENSYAYGDHHSDIPMLKTVGNPVAVAVDKSLINHAHKHKWDTIPLGLK